VNSSRGLAIVPEAVRALVNDCSWFDELRDWRDLMGHYGAVLLTFQAPGQLAFQIHDRKQERRALLDELGTVAMASTPTVGGTTL
jgi:hypothetical protein